MKIVLDPQNRCFEIPCKRLKPFVFEGELNIGFVPLSGTCADWQLRIDKFCYDRHIPCDTGNYSDLRGGMYVCLDNPSDWSIED